MMRLTRILRRPFHTPLNGLAAVAAFTAAIATAPVASAAAPIDIRQGLVAYWPLDESPDGLTTPDLSPFGNGLQLVNMDATNFQPGQRGNAAQFNGTDELAFRRYVPGPSVGFPVSTTRRFTVALWVKGLGSSQQDKRIFSESSGTGNNQLFNLGTDSAAAATRTNVLDVYIRNDGGTALVNHRKSTNMVFDNTWHHLAWVQDNNTVRVYIDGNPDPADFSSAASTFTFDTVSIGGIQRATAGAFFNGLLDDVAVWERPLSQAEVQQVMTSGLTTPIPELPPLIIAEPVGATLPRGDNLTLRVVAVGNRPLEYQWQLDGNDIPGANSPTYTIFNASSTEAGTYTVSVRNIEGTVTSVPAVVAVLPDPPVDLQNGLISYWPMDTTDDATQTTPDLYSQNNFGLTFLSALDLVEGNTGLDKALRFDGFSQYARRLAGFPAYNSLSHSISFWVKGNGAAQFDLRVLAESSTNSANPLFTFGTQPSPGGAGLRVFIRNDTGTALLAQNSARPVFDDQWHHVVWTDSNGTARVYIDGILDPNSFRYTRGALTLNTTAIGAIVRATVGSFFNGALDEVAVWNRTLTFSEVQEIYTGRVPQPTRVLPPVITRQPVGADVFAGTDVYLSVEATGTALQFQWTRNGAPVPDGTNAMLTLTAATAANSGAYAVRVYNSADSVTSATVNVLVTTITDATTGLVAYWPLDTVTGTGTSPDSTPNGNDLTWVGAAPPQFIEGKRGSAIAFNGIDQYLVRDHRTVTSPGLPLSKHPAFTIAMWVKGLGNAQPATPNNGDRRVFSEGSSTNATPLLNLGTDNLNASLSADVFIRTDSGAVPVNHVKSANPAFDDTWRHVAYVDNNGTGRIYVDGVLDPAAISYIRSPLTVDNTTVGAILRTAPSHWFLGAIDDVAVWRRALTDSEVAYVMNNGAVPPPPLSVTDIQVTADFVTLRFTVPDPNQFYCIEESDELVDWRDVTNFALNGPNGNQYEAQIPRTAGPVRFYRILLCP